MMMAFVDWEGRPAVIVGSMAWAVLAPGEGWTEVNSSEVAESGRVTSARVLSAVYGPSLHLAGGNASLEKLIIAADRQTWWQQWLPDLGSEGASGARDRE